MKTFQRFLFVLTTLSLAACNQSPLLPEGSLSGETGILNLSAVHQLHDGSALAANEAGEKIVINDLGFQITLTHAEIGYRSLALVSSGDDPECMGGNDMAVTLNGSDDLLGEDLVEMNLGSHAIPLASFCSYILSVTLHQEGTWSRDGGTETAFEIESGETVTIEGAFGHPLHFHDGETETSKMFGVSYDALFDGVDFKNDDGGALIQKTAANLTGAVEVHSVH